jgi:hypothetical protein
MKTRYLFFFVLVALVLSAALPVGVVQAAGKTASLVEFKHVHGKGWTAVFQISGNWKAADLKGNTITVGGKTYDLYCNFRDDNHISCTMHHNLGQNIGRSARFNIAGLGVYNTYIAAAVPSKQICNSWTAKWKLEEGVEGWQNGTYLDQPYSLTVWSHYQHGGSVAYSDAGLLLPPSSSGAEENGFDAWEGYDVEFYTFWYEMFYYYDHNCSEYDYGADYVSIEDPSWWSKEAFGVECIDGVCEEMYLFESGNY